MANSIANLSRRISPSFLFNTKISQISRPFCTGTPSSLQEENGPDGSLPHNSDTDTVPTSTPQPPSSASPSSSSSPDNIQRREVYQQTLENGLDLGIYKAILVGQVGPTPFQKKLKSGRTITMLSLGTGGIRNNRRPLNFEEPKEYANRCSVQWHRVTVYSERLGSVVMKQVLPGSIMYMEGNLETKVFSDPVTGLVRRVREVAIRQDGRIVFLGKGGDDQQASAAELKGAGYY